MANTTTIIDNIKESIDLRKDLLSNQDQLNTIDKIVELMVGVFSSGHSVYICGNGGSAADAQHLSTELSGRYKMERKALPCEALHVNTSFITAVGNDYGFEEIYARGVEAFCKEGDILIALSTSGTSPNIIKALLKARQNNISTVGFGGMTGGDMVQYCDHILTIPSLNVPRIQECHMLIGHIICELVESKLFA